MIDIYYFFDKTRDKMKYLIMCLFLSTVLLGQNIRVALDSLSILDDERGIFHLELLSDTPKEKLILPKVDSHTVKYFTLFYCFKTSKDHNISILVDQQQDRDILYIDKNNDKNLTNDGEPIVFLHSQNKQYIDINAESDPKQIVRLVIYRIPPMPDSIRPKCFDSTGNLNPAIAKPWGSRKGDLNFKGTNGTFYCDDRVTLRRGKVEIDGIKYDIGLFDYSNNGLYNDDDDLLIVNLNRDGKLNVDDPNEVFKLNDVFRIGGFNYELSYVDKYGKNITLVKTDKSPTSYTVQYFQKQSSQSGQKNIINENFWETILTTIDGKSISVKDLKGKYIFLNIWGEWCLPCLKEIPELKESYSYWNEKVIFLSILNTQNINKAKELISKEKIIWPQVVMNPDLEKSLKINFYPTNILIFPDGKRYVEAGQLKKTFFDSNVK